MQVILPTLKDKAKDTIVSILGGKYVSQMYEALNLVSDVRSGSYAYVQDYVYLYAISDREVASTRFYPTVNPQQVEFPGSLDQMRKTWTFNSVNMPVSVTIPVQSGTPVEVHTGIKIVGSVYGMAYVHWLPSTSQLTSIVFTQTH